MSLPPNLADPQERSAYGRELRRVAFPLRLTGLAFILLGLALAVVRGTRWPEMPALIPLATLALGMLNSLGALVLRRVYHVRRMKGE